MKKRIPKFQECMRLMHKRDPQMQEDGFHLLLSQAHDYTQQLIEEFVQETDPGLRCWLLELLVETRNSDALPLFLQHLHSKETDLRVIAIRGLKQLDTKEARRALWEAGI